MFEDEQSPSNKYHDLAKEFRNLLETLPFADFLELDRNSFAWKNNANPRTMANRFNSLFGVTITDATITRKVNEAIRLHKEEGVPIRKLPERVRMAKTSMDVAFTQRFGYNVKTYFATNMGFPDEVKKTVVEATQLMMRADLTRADILRMSGHPATRDFEKDFERLNGMSVRAFKESITPEMRMQAWEASIYDSKEVDPKSLAVSFGFAADLKELKRVFREAKGYGLDTFLYNSAHLRPGPKSGPGPKVRLAKS
jgi:bacterioferritin (cytochrome b1)